MSASKSPNNDRNWGWCQTPLCATRVRLGTFVCEKHDQMIPDYLRSELAGISHAKLLLAPLSGETLHELDVIACALESIQTAQGVVPEARWNCYRFRWNQFIRALERPAASLGPGRGIEISLPLQPSLIDTTDHRRGPWE